MVTAPQMVSTVAAELEEIYSRHGGLRPDVVVAWAAKHPESAIHSRLTWDDTKAGQLYRLWQARELITEVEIIYPDGKERQLYVSPMITRRKEGYVPLPLVLSRKSLRISFLEQALLEYERLGMKYRDLRELARVRQAVERAKAMAKRRRR
jgi:hypothetical protein